MIEWRGQAVVSAPHYVNSRQVFMGKFYHMIQSCSNPELSVLVYKVTRRVRVCCLAFVIIPLDYLDVVAFCITSALRPRVGKLYCEWSDSKYFRLGRSCAGRFFVIAAVGDCLAGPSACFVFYNLMLMCYALKIVCSLQSLLEAWCPAAPYLSVLLTQFQVAEKLTSCDQWSKLFLKMTSQAEEGHWRQELLLV